MDVLQITNFQFLCADNDYFCPMLAVQNTLVSDDLTRVRFVCDLKKCHGACCVDGDAGAPLDEDEIGTLEDCLDAVIPYMTEAGITMVESRGVFDYDELGNYVTPLVNERECAFAIFEGDTAKCAIEKAYTDGKIKFQKPISCHLYPVRLIKTFGDDMVNYHEWHVCRFALIHGRRLDVPLYKFLKDPLIRKYGRKWYADLTNQIKAEEAGNKNLKEV